MSNRNQILEAMEKYFGKDEKRKNHARRVLGYADRILETENGDLEIVEAAAILHDIGIHEAERKYGSTAGKYQEIEGPSIAEDILESLGFPENKLKDVLEIIAHHHSPGKVNTQNFKILYDADWLVNLKDEVGTEDADKLSRTIEKVFSTPAGKALAKKIYLSSKRQNTAGNRVPGPKSTC